MICWGGSPYPHCRCGHHRIDHIGYAPPNDRQHSRLSTHREHGCSAVVGSGWCKCGRYVPEWGTQ